MMMNSKPNVFKNHLVMMITKGEFVPVHDIEKSLYDEYQAIWKGIKYRAVKLKFLTKAVEEIEGMQADVSEFEKEDLAALVKGAQSLISDFIATKEVEKLKTLNTIISKHQNELTNKFRPLFLKAFSKPVAEKLNDLLRRERAFAQLMELQKQVDALAIEEIEFTPAEILSTENPEAFEQLLSDLHAINERYSLPDDEFNMQDLESHEKATVSKISTPAQSFELFRESAIPKESPVSSALRAMAAH